MIAASDTPSPVQRAVADLLAADKSSEPLAPRQPALAKDEFAFGHESNGEKQKAGKKKTGKSP